MTHAIQYETTGGPEVLTFDEIDPPSPGAGEVAVRVAAAGVNPIDVKLRSGLRPAAGTATIRRVGSDGAGHISAVGEGVDGFRIGDPVAFTGAHGSYATDTTVAAHQVFSRPAGVTAAQGAAIGIPAGTAYQTLRSLGVRADDTLLLHGGSGAVGQAAIQFAVLTGARVLATTSPERAETVRALGAEPILYTDDVAAEVTRLAPEGVTVIADLVGTDDALQTSLGLGVDPARIATIVMGAKAADLGIRAFGGGSPEPLTAQQNTWRMEAIPVALALLAVGRFHIELGSSYSLADAAAAHRDLESGARGKIILTP